MSCGCGKHSLNVDDILEILNQEKQAELEQPTDTFEQLKDYIETIQKVEEDLQAELKRRYVMPVYDQPDELEKIIKDLPRGMTRYLAKGRLEELKHK